MIRKNNIIRNVSGKIYVLLMIACLLSLPSIHQFKSNIAHAAPITLTSDMVTRNQISVPSDHTITFVTPTGVTGYSENIIITFPVAFGLTGVDYADIDLAVGSSVGSCSSFSDRVIGGLVPGVDWGAFVSSNVINLYGPTSGNIATTGIPAGYCVQIEIGKNATGGADQITNPSTPSNQAIMLDVGGNDLGVTYVTIITDDQVDIYATVDSILSLYLSDVAVGFGTFVANTETWATYDGNPPHTDPGTGSGPVTITSMANANQGYTISLRSTGTGSSAGLYNPIAPKLVPTVGAASVTGGEAYAAYTGKLSGTITLAGGFSGATSTTAMTTSDQVIASTSAPIASNSFDLYLKAIVSGTTPAGLYSDTLVITCTPLY